MDACSMPGRTYTTYSYCMNKFFSILYPAVTFLSSLSSMTHFDPFFVSFNRQFRWTLKIWCLYTGNFTPKWKLLSPIWPNISLKALIYEKFGKTNRMLDRCSRRFQRQSFFHTSVSLKWLNRFQKHTHCTHSSKKKLLQWFNNIFDIFEYFRSARQTMNITTNCVKYPTNWMRAPEGCEWQYFSTANVNACSEFFTRSFQKWKLFWTNLHKNLLTDSSNSTNERTNEQNV